MRLRRELWIFNFSRCDVIDIYISWAFLRKIKHAPIKWGKIIICPTRELGFGVGFDRDFCDFVRLYFPGKHGTLM